MSEVTILGVYIDALFLKILKRSGVPHDHILHYYTVSQKNPCDYVFDDNLNSKCPIVIIFGTIIT